MASQSRSRVVRTQSLSHPERRTKSPRPEVSTRRNDAPGVVGARAAAFSVESQALFRLEPVFCFVVSEQRSVAAFMYILRRRFIFHGTLRWEMRPPLARMVHLQPRPGYIGRVRKQFRTVLTSMRGHTITPSRISVAAPADCDRSRCLDLCGRVRWTGASRSAKGRLLAQER
jgi:hypothetical protein